MDKHNYSAPVSLKNIQVTDTFWKGEMELVRKEVIPYQWDALNDRVEGAAPSFCMHNFKAAGKLNREKKEKGNTFIAPKYTFRGFEVLPEDPKQLKDDEFYGFVPGQRFFEMDRGGWLFFNAASRSGAGKNRGWRDRYRLRRTAGRRISGHLLYFKWS